MGPRCNCHWSCYPPLLGQEEDLVMFRTCTLQMKARTDFCPALPNACFIFPEIRVSYRCDPHEPLISNRLEILFYFSFGHNSIQEWALAWD